MLIKKGENSIFTITKVKGLLFKIEITFNQIFAFFNYSYDAVAVYKMLRGC